jgi:hypothetical protein
MFIDRLSIAKQRGKKDVACAAQEPLLLKKMKAILDFPFDKLNVFLVQAALTILLIVLLWRFVASHIRK